MAHQLGAQSILVDGLSLDSSVHAEWFTVTYNSILGNLTSSRVLQGHLHSHAQTHTQNHTCPHTETYTYAHNLKIKMNLKKTNGDMI